MEHKKHANPAPLGLLGFAFATIMLNIHNAGFMNVNPQVIAMGFAMGAIAQIIAGVKEFKTGNTFGFTAFTAYGLFWLALVLIWTNKLTTGQVIDASETHLAMGMFLLLWGIFTTFMFIGTLKHSKTSQIVFGLLAILFYILALYHFTEVKVILTIAGYVGILTGIAAFYNAVAQIVNEEHQKPMLPL